METVLKLFFSFPPTVGGQGSVQVETVLKPLPVFHLRLAATNGATFAELEAAECLNIERVEAVGQG